MNDIFVSKTQLELLPARVLLAEKTNASVELYNSIYRLSNIKKRKQIKILVVGSGGSYPAAVFAKHELSAEMRTPYVDAVTPQTAIQIITQFNIVAFCSYAPEYDLVIGISYSGKTADIKAVADLCATRGFPFILLTGTNKQDLEDFYTESELVKIISYFNSDDSSGREEGMISMASTIIPCMILDDTSSNKLIALNQKALSAGKSFVDELNISEIAKQIKKHPIIHVFYDWNTYAVAADIESKFTQSGIANVILHEKKNFSHGRYTSLYNQKFAMIIDLTWYCSVLGSKDKVYRTKYEKELAIFLKDVCDANSSCYINIGTSPLTVVQWIIEALAIIPYFITAIGEELGIDISNPLIPFPKETTKLYNYNGWF